MKPFKPPTQAEFCQYIKDRKINIKNPEMLYNGYNDGDWHDTQGKSIRNWKLKLCTLHNFAKPNADIPQSIAPLRKNAEGKTILQLAKEKQNAD